MHVLPLEWLVRLFKTTKGHSTYDVFYVTKNNKAFVVFQTTRSISYAYIDHVTDVDVSFQLYRADIDKFKSYKIGEIATLKVAVLTSGQFFINDTRVEEDDLYPVDFDINQLTTEYDIDVLVQTPSMYVEMVGTLLDNIPPKTVDFYPFGITSKEYAAYTNSWYALDEDKTRLTVLDLPDIGLSTQVRSNLYLLDLINLLSKSKVAYANWFAEDSSFYAYVSIGKNLTYEFISRYTPTSPTYVVPAQLAKDFDVKAVKSLVSKEHIGAFKAHLKTFKAVDILPMPLELDKRGIYSAQVRDLSFIYSNLVDTSCVYVYDEWVNFDLPGLSIYLTLYNTVYGTHESAA